MEDDRFNTSLYAFCASILLLVGFLGYFLGSLFHDESMYQTGYRDGKNKMIATYSTTGLKQQK